MLPVLPYRVVELDPPAVVVVVGGVAVVIDPVGATWVRLADSTFFHHNNFS